MTPLDPRAESQSQPEQPPLTGERELALYRSGLESVQEEVRRLFSPLSDEELNRRPEPDRWSAGECVDHLVVIGNLLVPLMQKAILAGRGNRWLAEGPFRYSWPGRMFVESLQPGARLKIKTQHEYRPARMHAREELLRRFDAVQEGLIRSVNDSAGLDLVRIKVPSPARRFIRLSLGIWFASTVAHERRHSAQAARALAGKEGE